MPTASPKECIDALLKVANERRDNPRLWKYHYHELLHILPAGEDKQYLTDEWAKMEMKWHLAEWHDKFTASVIDNKMPHDAVSSGDTTLYPQRNQAAIDAMIKAQMQQRQYQSQLSSYDSYSYYDGIAGAGGSISL